MKFKKQATLLFMVLILFPTSAAISQDAGSALDLMFDPYRTQVIQAKQTKWGTRGLAARTTFIDLLKSSKPKLQIALVIDGSNSMRNDIDTASSSVIKMIDALVPADVESSNIEFALVVYRDVSSKSGAVTMPINEFTKDVDRIQAAVGAIETENNMFFYETIDWGVAAAINDLNWDEGEDTTRWTLIIGDAPPYKHKFPTEFKDPNNPGKKLAATGRKFTNEELVKLATDKGISLSSILCSSGCTPKSEDEPGKIDNEKLVEIYQDKLPEMQLFIKDLHEGTGGTFIDLSSSELVAELSAKARDAVKPVKIAKITQKDLEEFRQQHFGGNEVTPIRFAILPHVNLDSSYDESELGVQITSELKEKLESYPNVVVSNLAETRQVVEEKKVDMDYLENPGPSMQRIAAKLKVDFVISGMVEKTDKDLSFTTAVYKRVGGKRIASSSDKVDTDSDDYETVIFGSVLEQLTKKLASQKSDYPSFEKAFASPGNGAEDYTLEQIAKSNRAVSNLRSGLLSAESCLNKPVEDPSFDFETMNEAKESFEAVIRQEPENALAHSWLASCCNALFYKEELNAENKSLAVQMNVAIGKAYKLREYIARDDLKLEIEADFAFFSGFTGTAIENYTKLAEGKEDTPLAVARRARWMLAGIYSGDWNSTEQNSEKAREQIVAIMALWPDSPEADFYKRMQVWSEESGETKRHEVSPLPRRQLVSKTNE